MENQRPRPQILDLLEKFRFRERIQHAVDDFRFQAMLFEVRKHVEIGEIGQRIEHIAAAREAFRDMPRILHGWLDKHEEAGWFTHQQTPAAFMPASDF